VKRNAPDRLPSYPLIGYRARWRVVSETGELLGKGEAPLSSEETQVVEGRWAARPGTGLVLDFEVVAPDGARAWRGAFDYVPLRIGSSPFPPDPKELGPKPSEPRP
jgi:beta-glucuronidase